MVNPSEKDIKNVLNPIDRTSEILFGLIMTLTFTCSISVAQDGHAEVKTMLLGALGCNIAWGIIDGAFFVMAGMAEKARNLNTLKTVRESADAELGMKLISDALPPLFASVLKPEELEAVRMRIVDMPDLPFTARLEKKDIARFFSVFALVVFATFPVVIPFILFSRVIFALRLSNAVAMAMLFAAGYKLGKARGRGRYRTGIVFVGIGALMVALCIALGG